MTVTVILATYKRPGALSVAIETLRLQTVTDWRAIVVGDCCGPETGEAVAAFADPRLRYVNLPERCGEQSLPNSVGMRLADTPLLAFLNHDDLWLPDHLEKAQAALSDPAADFFFGISAFADERVERRPRFHRVNNQPRVLLDCFHGSKMFFEPASAWVFRKSLAERVGDWRHSGALYRTPLEDWILRAARTDARLVMGDEVSVLRIATHRNVSRDKKQYNLGAADQRAMRDAIVAGGAAGVRAMIEQDIRRGVIAAPKKRAPRQKPARQTRKMFLDPAAAQTFYQTGADAYDDVCQQSGKARGHGLRDTTLRRVGEVIERPPTVEALVQAVRPNL
jgi:glycosyltransferase involved in cell wall biosynthesis